MNKFSFGILAILISSLSFSFHANAEYSDDQYYSMSCHELDKKMWSYEAKLENAQDDMDDADIDYIFADDDVDEFGSMLDGAVADMDIDAYNKKLSKIRHARSHKQCNGNGNNHHANIYNQPKNTSSSMSCADISRQIWSYEAKLENAKDDMDDADIDYLFADDDVDEFGSMIDGAVADMNIDTYNEKLRELKQTASYKRCRY